MDIKRVVNFEIGGNPYQLTIPTNRTLIAIEVKKAQLSKDQYFTMMRTPTILATTVLDLIDAYCWLTIACPQFQDDTRINDILDLDVLDSQSILKAYREHIAPWIASWQEALSAVAKEAVDEEK